MVKTTDRKKRLRKRKILKKIKWFCFFFFILCFLIGVIWIIFFSPIFKIKQINLSGEDPADRQAVMNFLTTSLESRSWLNMGPLYVRFLKELSYNDKNSLFQNFDALEKGFEEDFPEYSDSHIDFDWWRQTLNLSLSKRVVTALWCNDSKCGFIDENGLYFKDLAINDKQTLLQDPVYADYFLLKGQFKETSQPITVGSSIVPPEIINNLRSWFHQCQGTILSYREISLDESSLECFSATTNVGFHFTFKPSDDASEILQVVKELQIQTKNNPQWQGLASMNFCFYPKIYYIPDGFFRR